EFCNSKIDLLQQNIDRNMAEIVTLAKRQLISAGRWPRKKSNEDISVVVTGISFIDTMDDPDQPPYFSLMLEAFDSGTSILGDDEVLTITGDFDWKLGATSLGSLM
ncbi:MAG: hypothetical protein ABL888_21780, partial [Pirellulaceae bacterium]